MRHRSISAGAAEPAATVAAMEACADRIQEQDLDPAYCRGGSSAYSVKCGITLRLCRGDATTTHAKYRAEIYSRRY